MIMMIVRMVIMRMVIMMIVRMVITDMIFVTSSTSSASVKYFLARVKLSMGNAQSVFFSRCNSVEKAPRGQRCKNYPRVVNK